MSSLSLLSAAADQQREFRKILLCDWIQPKVKTESDVDKLTSVVFGQIKVLVLENLAFGHSGFTGNLTWADPESGLIYVFLSNRVYPDAENHKLITMNIRTEVMQVITDALELKFPLEAQ